MPNGYKGATWEASGAADATQPFAAGIAQFGADWQTRVTGFDARLSVGHSFNSGAISLPGISQNARGALESGASLPVYGAFNSALSVAAAALLPGQSVDFTSPTEAQYTQSGGGKSDTLGNYMARFHYDATTREYDAHRRPARISRAPRHCRTTDYSDADTPPPESVQFPSLYAQVVSPG